MALSCSNMDVLAALGQATKQLAAKPSKTDVPIECVAPSGLPAWLKQQPLVVQNWLQSIGFSAKGGRPALIPNRSGDLQRVIAGIDPKTSTPWKFAGLVGALPKGRYAFQNLTDEGAATSAAIGWALATYRFTRYKRRRSTPPILVWPELADRAAVERLCGAIFFGRDLINTPTEDMGPAELAAAASSLGRLHGAIVNVVEGDALLDKGYPAIHAVGRASPRAPRLVDITWGNRSAPRLRLVGKGVCFDTGGLDLKSAADMKLMKKDMGGAASVLALAHMIMDAKLRVHLRVLIPMVENSVSGNAFRPGDVLQTRKGLTVEVGNTDAEGRLILCDALAEADRDDPDLIIDFATLTGAARVALGTELPALFSNDKKLGAVVIARGRKHYDPLWPLPLFKPYRRYLESSIADLNNIASVPYGGAITAGLFLREFVRPKTPWIHIDTMAWNLSSRPGRPAGGEILGVRAVFAALAERYSG